MIQGVLAFQAAWGKFSFSFFISQQSLVAHLELSHQKQIAESGRIRDKQTGPIMVRIGHRPMTHLRASQWAKESLQTKPVIFGFAWTFGYCGYSVCSFFKR